MPKNIPWTTEEDNIILTEIVKDSMRSNTEIAEVLIKNPVFIARSIHGLRQHVGYLRNGGIPNATI